MSTCTHLDTIEFTDVPEGDLVCPQCVEMGSHWLHLRRCTQCGQVGCCDSSPNTHATKHHEATGHPIIRSIQPGESWFWCYEDELTFALDGVE
jgi:CPA2 family monovalent cation:H+ antiporter-2